jgi:hypothetical protein
LNEKVRRFLDGHLVYKDFRVVAQVIYIHVGRDAYLEHEIDNQRTRIHRQMEDYFNLFARIVTEKRAYNFLIS